MSKPRVTTPKQDAELAEWFCSTRTVHAKAQEMGISVSALYDAVARGRSMPTSGERFKIARFLDGLEATEDDNVSRESPHSEAN